MPFKYDKLWDILAQKKMSKTALRDIIGSSQTTMVSLANNENVSLSVIDRICEKLDIHPFEFIEYYSNIQEDDNTIVTARRGDIYYAELGERMGAVVGGVRPVLILQNDDLHSMPTIMAIPLTSNIPTILPDNIFVVNPSSRNNLQRKAALLLEQTRSVSRTSLKERIGILEPEYMEQINALLIKILTSEE